MLVRALVLFVLFNLNAENGIADILQTSNPFMTEIQHTAESFGDPIVDRLAAYKKVVENTSYETTLKLCEGYRRAQNMGPHPYHSKWMYSLDQSMAAWAKVAKEGAVQPLSAIGGLKADYLTLQNIGFFDFESWFGSMYTLYLVNSLGFLGGAMHCLNTMNESDINYFASTIMIVDYEMSLLTHAGMGAATTKIFSLIIKASKGVWRPLSVFLKTAKKRIPPTPLKIAGFSFGAVIADNLLVYIDQRQESIKVIQELLTEGSALNGDLQKHSRFLKLNHAYEIALKQSQLEMQLRSENKPFSEDVVYQPLYEHLKKNFDSLTLVQMNLDLLALQYTPRLSEQEMAYLKLLEAFLPIVEELINNKKLL